MFDLISIGDATEDVFMQLKEASVHCEKGTSKCTLCMDFATKIPVDRVDKLIGGNAANVAVGASRLGMRSAFYCVLGKDEQGELIKILMVKDNVSTKYIQLKKNTKTNYSVELHQGIQCQAGVQPRNPPVQKRGKVPFPLLKETYALFLNKEETQFLM